MPNWRQSREVCVFRAPSHPLVTTFYVKWWNDLFVCLPLMITFFPSWILNCALGGVPQLRHLLLESKFKEVDVKKETTKIFLSLVFVRYWIAGCRLSSFETAVCERFFSRFANITVRFGVVGLGGFILDVLWASAGSTKAPGRSISHLSHLLCDQAPSLQHTCHCLTAVAGKKSEALDM